MQSTRLLSIAISLILLASCGHLRGNLAEANRPTPTFPFYARQCIKTREVICQLDKDLTAEQCQTTVVPSIEAINNAVGRPVYHYLGNTNSVIDAMLAIGAGVYVIGGTDLSHMGDPNARTLGLTQLHGSSDDPRCIDRVYTVLDPVVFLQPRYNPTQVMTHEMIHGLGGMHALPDAAFQSIMTPAVNGFNAVPTISANDAATLRWAYGN